MGYADAIASIESGGNYGILGPATKGGDRAYGKYQVMGNNIPDWSKQYYGKSLSPQEFLASPEAQDAVFQGKFGEYADKYGPEGAARAWFAGPGNMNNPNASDGNMTVAQYADKFRSAMAPPLPTTNVASLPPIAGPQQPQGPPTAAPQQQQPQAAAVPAAAPAQAATDPLAQMQAMQLGLKRMGGFNPMTFAKIPLPQGFRGYVPYQG